MTLEVISNMPKTAMGHNIAIVDKDADVDEFVMQSMSAKDNEYIAPALEDQVVAFTEMIGGGETSVIEFTVPEEPGDYVFVCTFPGHYFAGMKGILRVK
jgi:azurin